MTLDKAVYRELREIADYIQSMKDEIGALQVHDLKESAFRPPAWNSTPSSRRPRRRPTPS